MNTIMESTVSGTKTMTLDLGSEQEIVQILESAYKSWKNRKAYLSLLEEAVEIMSGFNNLARYTDLYNGVDSLDKYNETEPPRFELGQTLTKESLLERHDYILMTLMVISHGNKHGIYRRRVMDVFEQMNVLLFMFGLMESRGYDSDKHLIWVEESANSPSFVNLTFKFPSEKEAA